MHLFLRWKLFLPQRIMAKIWPQSTTCWRNTSCWRQIFLPMRYGAHYCRWVHVGQLYLREHARPYCRTCVNIRFVTNWKIPTKWVSSHKNILKDGVGNNAVMDVELHKVSEHLSPSCRIVWRIWTARLTAWWPAMPLTPHRWRRSVMLSTVASPRSRAWLQVAVPNSTSPTACISSSGTWMMKSLGSSKRVPLQIVSWSAAETGMRWCFSRKISSTTGSHPKLNVRC